MHLFLKRSSKALFLAIISSCFLFSSSSFLVRWNLSRKDPSLEKTFKGLAFVGCALAAAPPGRGGTKDDRIGVSDVAGVEAGDSAVLGVEALEAGLDIILRT